MANNLPPFLSSGVSPNELKHKWLQWRRAFSHVLVAENVKDDNIKKSKLLALGGFDLQDIFYSIPGADIDKAVLVDGVKKTPYEFAIDKLDGYFAPQHHASYERFMYWTLKPEAGESLHKFIMRANQQAMKCNFGTNENESREISVLDKAILLASPELREKLLQREMTLTEALNCINTFEAVNFQNRQISKEPLSTNSLVNFVKRQKYPPQNKEFECYRCGDKNHLANNPSCPAFNALCKLCKKKGHFAAKCRTRKQTSFDDRGRYLKRPRYSNTVNAIDNYEADENEYLYHENPHDVICNIGESDDIIFVKIAGVITEMLIDSGCKYNILDERSWSQIRQQAVTNDYRLQEIPKTTFKSYGSKIPLKVVASFATKIEIPHFNRATVATFHVVQYGNISLLGKDTAMQLGVLKLGVTNFVNNVNEDLHHVFPKVRDVLVEIPINKEIPPVVQSVRRPPISLLKLIDLKLKELLELDIIEEVNEPSLWVSPLVPIIKDDGNIRLCIDMRKANEAILRQNHPLPTMEDFLPRLREAKYFSKLDIKNAFHQLELSKTSRYITTFITHKGMFRYKRLLFGVNCAPEIFQKTLETILCKCKNALNYIDDIIVFGADKEEHDDCLRGVLKVFQERGVFLNSAKCIYGATEVEFLGHILSRDGIQPSYNKIETLKNFRSPKNIDEVRSFLGLINYLGRFIPNLADKTYSLRQLLRKDSKFGWSDTLEDDFQNLKLAIADIKSLAYFDVKRPTRLIADASPVALGAVLIQFKDEVPYPIAYAHKSLTETEKRYCQTEKEALALVWAVEKFSIYLLATEFELETDHKPLEAIFTPRSKPCARIERWVLRLQSYKFKVVYRPGSKNIADSLSRLCKLDASDDFDDECEVYINSIVQSAAIDIFEIENESKADLECQRLKISLESGKWPENDDVLKPFARFKDELCLQNSLIVRGLKLFIPKKLRSRMLDLSHEGHPGESVMKRRLRERVWWPGIDYDVTQYVKSCYGCQLVAMPSKPDPMIRRELPSAPWVDLALDFLGPLPSGENLLVLIDYYSRYKEVEILFKITSANTIQRLDKIFIRLGYPFSITLDNAKQFVSTEFTEYCKQKGIHLNNTIPYWPQQNGEVERQNRSLLKRLKISSALNRNWKTDLSDYLLMYNTTPHSVTGKTPTELCIGRTIRGKIPSIKDLDRTLPAADEELRDRDFLSKAKGKDLEDRKRQAKSSTLEVGENVLVQRTVPSNKLATTFHKESHIILEKEGSRVKVMNNKTHKIYERNSAHLKSFNNNRHEDISRNDPEELVERRSSRPKKLPTRFRDN